MPEIKFSHLPDRGVVCLTGSDCRGFLQGLISNDIDKVSETRSIYATFLTPQGKFLFDLFISQTGESLLIDCEKERQADFMKRLRLYKLRADVSITDCSDELGVTAYWGDGCANAAQLTGAAGSARSIANGTLSIDPRLSEAGLRAIIPTDGYEPAGLEDAVAADYDLHRLSLGLPRSGVDLIVDKSILLECGVDELNGIDWKKGCYMGQEVTARSKYRGLIKKRLVPVEINGAAPAAGSLILTGDKQAGEMRSSAGNRGLALMRLEYLDGPGSFTSSDDPEVTLTARKPDWAVF